MLKFIIQKILNKKWMAFSLFLGNVLLIAIACANPMYSQAMLQRTLIRDMNTYMEENNRYPGAISFKSNHYAYMDEEGDKLQTVESIYKEMLQKIPVPKLTEMVYNINTTSAVSKMQDKKVRIQLASYSDIEDHIEILHGNWYSTEIKDNVIEVIVNERTFIKQSLTMGEEWELSDLRDEKGTPYRMRVVGIFDNIDEMDPYWESSPDDWVVRYVMDENLFEQIASIDSNRDNLTRGWYTVLDYVQMKENQVERILEGIHTALDSTEKLEYTYVTINFQETLEKFVPKEQKLNITIMMLQIPTFVLLVAFIFMVSGQMLDMEQNEISVFKSRGASKGQIILLYLLQSLFIAGLGLVVGIPTGMVICKVIGASNAFLEFVSRTALPVRINGTVIGFALAAALFSVGTMVLPVLKMANTSIVAAKRKKNRKKDRTWWKVVGMDIILLAGSIYGLYQFKGQEEFLAEQAAQGAALDPILYSCSSLFMLGAGLFILRILPLLTRAVFEVGKKWWSPGIYASFLRILRTNNNQGFLVVFLVLTVSIGIFNTQTARTINANGEEQISYSIGADLVVQEKWQDNSAEIAESKSNEESESAEEIELTYIEPDFGKYVDMDGVEKVTRVLVDHDITVSLPNGKLENVMIMGIHTKEFGETVRFKEDLLENHWYEYLNAISQNSNAVLVSSNFKDVYGYKLGDIINYANAEGDYVRGIIFGFVDYWPTYAPVIVAQDKDGIEKKMDNFLIVAHLSQLQSKWGITPYQVWIKTEGSSQFLYQYAEESGTRYTLFEDMAADLVELKNESVFQGTNGVLTISFIVVLLLCATGFLIYWILSIQSRTLQFGIFRAMGMSQREVLTMLVVEQIFISGTAIGGGVLVGKLVSKFFVPLIQIAYSTADRVLPLDIIDAASDYLRLGIVIGLMIVVCMIVLGVLISKIKITQALKLGED